MRALPLCLLALSLTGCSMLQNGSSTNERMLPNKPQPTIKNTQASAPRPAPVKLYKTAEELVGKPFRDLGEVSGESCQTSAQDSPPNIATARKRMQIKASYIKANAVLLHECQILSGVPGCYQQAICQGSALNVSSK
ncbi:colanic acid biosynthesis protein RcsF [Yersinia ruckeri]|uniref:Rcs stress response system protein RcsF n=1 Tax=Yersinia ruckeri TaxID=29486 RepID=UPI0008FE6243|nr:Rcs stress response system protein RcsF [Yersinia ruckeri]MCK8586415.1 Rcs stress response system protein RcsF [Yersinia ruckeri]OJB82639.1 colanic acid biosynthesis protein RcsF [Yersinia ruckeri]OJB88845.1 colanic acid biosynthesis protein RcsF [Yersinia ruckeri]